MVPCVLPRSKSISISQFCSVKRIPSRNLSDRLSKIFEGRITFLDLPNLWPGAISLIVEHALQRAENEVAPLVSLLALHSDGNRASFH